MGESTAPVKGPRFPWVAALICAASLGVAAWMWMRYSYCWPMDPGRLNERARDIAERRWPDQALVRISRLHGPDVTFTDSVVERSDFTFSDEYMSAFLDSSLPEDRAVFIITRGPDDIVDDVAGRSGRVIGVAIVGIEPSAGDDSPTYDEVATYVNSRASRFHPASITGLVVGAMGVAVFVMCLRTWFRERKAAA